MEENESKLAVARNAEAASDDSVSGLNDNIQFVGKLLHVQTEKIVLPEPHIVTQVFSNGRIVFSKKTAFPCDTPDVSRIRDLMRTQHFKTIQEIEEKQKKILSSHE